MEVLRGGEKVELVGNPPMVGEQLPKFKENSAYGRDSSHFLPKEITQARSMSSRTWLTRSTCLATEDDTPY